jgi:hypothetical protein
MHELHELRKRLLVTSQRFVDDCDHISFAPGYHFAVFAALIAIQYVFYADTGGSLRPSRRAACSTLAKLGMSRWLAVADLVIVAVGSGFGWVNIGFVG